jgi:HEAT repeat protein
MPRPEDLLPWNDPDELLQALYQLDRKPDPDLRESVAQLLRHDDDDVREEALRILLTRWKDQEFRGYAISALQQDPAASVRSAAAFAIASTSQSGTRAEDIKALVTILLDEDEDLDVRAAAYDALLILHRRPTFPTKKRTFNPAADVDWPWIATLQ